MTDRIDVQGRPIEVEAVRHPGRNDKTRRRSRGKLYQRMTPTGGRVVTQVEQPYRRLPDVLAQHAGTVKIEHTLRPFAVVMAGADVFDPFKD